MADITVDLDNATIGDLRLFEKFQDNTHTVDELLEFLGRVVESETKIEDLPLLAMREIMRQVGDAAQSLGGDDEKN